MYASAIFDVEKLTQESIGDTAASDPIATAHTAYSISQQYSNSQRKSSPIIHLGWITGGEVPRKGKEWPDK